MTDGIGEENVHEGHDDTMVVVGVSGIARAVFRDRIALVESGQEPFDVEHDVLAMTLRYRGDEYHASIAGSKAALARIGQRRTSKIGWSVHVDYDLELQSGTFGTETSTLEEAIAVALVAPVRIQARAEQRKQGFWQREQVRVAREAGLPSELQGRPWREVAREIARQMVTGEIAPLEGAGRLRRVWSEAGEPDELAIWPAVEDQSEAYLGTVSSPHLLGDLVLEARNLLDAIG